MPCASFAEPLTVRGKCNQEWTPYIPCSPKGRESHFGSDGHSYLTRAFFIGFVGEEVELNEVVQFQLRVNLPANATPSSIMQCKLDMDLLYEKKSAASVGGDATACGDDDDTTTVAEGLCIVSSVSYSLKIPTEGIHEMTPITFSSPYCVWLDGMIHCALLNLRPIKEEDVLWFVEGDLCIDDESINIMAAKSLNSILLAVKWLLSLESNLQPKEKAFIRETQVCAYDETDMREIVNLLKNFNNHYLDQFSSLIHYLENGGISSLIQNSNCLATSANATIPCESSTPQGASLYGGGGGGSQQWWEWENEEDVDVNISLVFELCFVYWNLFFHLLPSRRAIITENLRSKWLYQCQQESTSVMLQHTSYIPSPNLMRHNNDSSLSTILECDFEQDTAKGLWMKLWSKLNRNNVKDDERLGQERLRRNVVRMPDDLGCCDRSPPMFLCQRYSSVKNDSNHVNNRTREFKLSIPSSTSLLDGIERSCSLGTFFRSFRNPPPRPHLIVLQHGFRGKAYDMHLLANQLRILIPDAYVLCPKANENKPDARLEEMGSNIADEVVNYIERHFPTTLADGGEGGLSFVGFSAGSLVIRCMLNSEKLKPYHHCLHIFLSLSSPHLGIATQAGSVKAAAIWGLRKCLKEPILDQLTQTDASSLKDTLLYQLSDSPYLSLFRAVSE